MILVHVVSILLTPLAWLANALVVMAWSLVKTAFWILSPAIVLAVILGILAGCRPDTAKAGWLWGPDPATEAKAEAANRALQHAASIATEAARTQSSQQQQVLATVEALSNERTQLASHLKDLGTLAAKDSAWAAALSTAGPVFIAIAVLAFGCSAVWMLTRSADRDAELANVLVEEIAGHGTGVLIRRPSRKLLAARHRERAAMNLDHTANPPEPHREPEEMPF
jgi:ABC-type multidrug transport system fused ATPase/permease subunit